MNDDILEIEITKEDEEEILVKYDIATYPSDFTLKVLWEMWKEGNITIPDFQREFVWSIKQSSLLIESFLIGLPVPPVFFYIDDYNNNLVIDGQQRLMSIFNFLEGYFGKENEKGKRQIFRLNGLNSKNPYYNKRFEDLEEKDRKKLENSVLRAINVRQLSPDNNNTSIYHIFERLNTGGTPLKSQEIRNCVYRGIFLKQLQELNKDSNWRLILGKKIEDKHQNDVELILRAIGLSMDLKSYEKPMKEFLNKTSKKYRNIDLKTQTNFYEDFKKATRIIVEKLRSKPFSVRGPLNTSLFDSVFCTILNNIDDLPEDISNRYEELLLNEKFIEQTTLATTDEKILKERFAFVKLKLID